MYFFTIFVQLNKYLIITIKFMFYTELVIKSNLDKLIDVEQFIDSLMLDFSIKEDYLGIIATPLLEAVKNAIVHGNQSNTSKEVTITCQISNKDITFSVSDEGLGFDFKKFLDEDFDNRTSKGLTMIELLTTKLEFLNNGSTISYTIDIPIPIQQERPLEAFHSQVKQEQLKTVF